MPITGWYAKLAGAVALVLVAILVAVVLVARLDEVTPGSRVSPAASPATHLMTLPPGASLPTDEICANRVRQTNTVENRNANAPFNETTGQLAGQLFPAADARGANETIAPRIDGKFTGTTAQILRWAACKWGIDEDLVFAQAAVESFWRQTTLGDWGPDPAACAPGHGIGQDGKQGLCPESYGILQNRYALERTTWPAAERSTAMNADVAYAIWRACFEGYELWLNNVNRVGRYSAGDAWGCIGRWFAGRWHTKAAEQYIAKVQAYLARRIWEQPGF